MPSLVTLPASTSVCEVLEVFARDGAVIVEGLLEPDLVARLRSDLDIVVQGMAPGSRSGDPVVQEFWGDHTKRFGRLAWRSPSFVDVLLHPVISEISDRLLLPNAVDWWLNSAQMMVIGPDEDAQVLHRDVNNWPHFERPDAIEVTVSWMLAVGDFTAANGATRVVPGSHAWTDYDRDLDGLETVAAEMPAGSGLLYAGRAVHGGGANTTTDDWRLGMHLSHVVGWLTPEEALPLAAPWEFVRELPELAQRRLGWRCYPADSVVAGRLWTIDYEDIPLGLGLDLETTVEPLTGALISE
jgi:ectoine hydroxylase-related dioxygenase (phytanoyl-CoA dioxygenase family)